MVRRALEENMTERPGWNMSALLGWWNLIGSVASLGGARCRDVRLVVLVITVATVLWLLMAVNC